MSCCFSQSSRQCLSSYDDASKVYLDSYAALHLMNRHARRSLVRTRTFMGGDDSRLFCASEDSIRGLSFSERGPSFGESGTSLSDVLSHHATHATPVAIGKEDSGDISHREHGLSSRVLSVLAFCVKSLVRPPGFGPGSLALFPQGMEGQWTLTYVLDQVVRMLGAGCRRSHALDYGRGRRCRASNRSNYAFARGGPDLSCGCQQIMHVLIGTNHYPCDSSSASFSLVDM
jgi:hypothetical protein